MSRFARVFQVSQGVILVDTLSYMKYDDDVWDSCLECNGMITNSVSQLIPRLSTNFARRHSTSGFGMGSAAHACSMILRRSNENISTREVLNKGISGECHKQPSGSPKKEFYFTLRLETAEKYNLRQERSEVVLAPSQFRQQGHFCKFRRSRENMNLRSRLKLSNKFCSEKSQFSPECDVSRAFSNKNDALQQQELAKEDLFVVQYRTRKKSLPDFSDQKVCMSSAQ